MTRVAIEELADRARRNQDAADRAFRRWFQGETFHAAAAQREQGRADEAWRELTSHPDYDPAVHGEKRMWGEEHAPGSVLESDGRPR